MTTQQAETPAPTIGSDTPWGPVQYEKQLAPGVVLVSTAGHGGIWLSDERWARFAEVAGPYTTWLSRTNGSGNGGRWFEEDHDALMPLAMFVDMEQDKRKQYLKALIRRSYRPEEEMYTAEAAYRIAAHWAIDLDAE